MTRRSFARPLFVLTVVACAAAQTPIAIEVASIRPNVNGGSDSVRLREGSGRFTAINQSARMLLLTAFDIRPFQLAGGPGWLDAARYDITAKTTGTGIITPEQYGPLLQSLLTERFALQYHRETRNLRKFSLVLANDRARLTPNTQAEGPEGLGTTRNNGRAVTTVTKKPLDEFAKFLGNQVEGFVTDDTGLRGRFDFRMEWSYNSDADPSGPSIFTALTKQLGLKLVSGKGPVEIIVIDRIVRASEN